MEAHTHQLYFLDMQLNMQDAINVFSNLNQPDLNNNLLEFHFNYASRQETERKTLFTF